MVCGDAGDEDVPLQLPSACARRSFDLVRGRSFLPVVRHVEHRVEPCLTKHTRNRCQIATIRLNVLDLRTEIMMCAAVQDRDVVTALRKPPDDLTADEESSADDQCFHNPIIDLRFPVVSFGNGTSQGGQR